MQPPATSAAIRFIAPFIALLLCEVAQAWHYFIDSSGKKAAIKKAGTSPAPGRDDHQTISCSE
jgi:hypothetical protein